MKPRRLKTPCTRCGREPDRYHGDRWLCIVHYRFETMRDAARLKRKYVPSHSELEALRNDLEMNGMKCRACECVMIWSGRPEDGNIVSLQHDASGSICFLCKRCNCKHGQLPGDLFYSLPEGQWYCAKCKTIKDIDGEFYRLNSGKLSSWCKSCRRSTNKEMWAKHGARWSRNSFLRRATCVS